MNKGSTGNLSIKKKPFQVSLMHTISLMTLYENKEMFRPTPNNHTKTNANNFSKETFGISALWTNNILGRPHLVLQLSYE